MTKRKQTKTMTRPDLPAIHADLKRRAAEVLLEDLLDYELAPHRNLYRVDVDTLFVLADSEGHARSLAAAALFGDEQICFVAPASREDVKDEWCECSPPFPLGPDDDRTCEQLLQEQGEWIDD